MNWRLLRKEQRSVSEGGGCAQALGWERTRTFDAPEGRRSRAAGGGGVGAELQLGEVWEQGPSSVLYWTLLRILYDSKCSSKQLMSSEQESGVIHVLRK